MTTRAKNRNVFKQLLLLCQWHDFKIILQKYSSYSVAIIVYDMEMQSTSPHIIAKGQVHLVTLAKDHLGWICLKSFFLESTWLIKIIF